MVSKEGAGGTPDNTEIIQSKFDAEPIFALDIGTRSVIGVLGIQQEDVFEILDVEVKEHQQRSMIDGQIEDIDQVAKIAGVVKRSLEERYGRPLKRVHIAAAGRSLKTARAQYEKDLSNEAAISRNILAEMETMALQNAQKDIMSLNEETDYYCVGYSVIRYMLDGYAMSTIFNHRGRHAQVEVIATFLPVQVVDSLHTVMGKIGLEVASLTLEPIAAMNAVIPKELRILNLALVDIGAGTSDIAISDDGSVVAYTMATIAGDEVTEAIVKSFLVDFQTAETMKSQLTSGADPIQYENILGIEQSATAQEMLESVEKTVQLLCAEIAQRILEINGKSPAAVFLVGGGSKTPSICEGVAECLDIDRKKVAVGSNNYMKRIISSAADITNPEFVTPVGIAITASMFQNNGFTIQINNKEYTIVKNGTVTVLDALRISGFDSRQIIGRSGQSVVYELNGAKQISRGGHPKPAEIYVNNALATIATVLSPGDQMLVIPAQEGENAIVRVRDILKNFAPLQLVMNGIPYEHMPPVFINSKPAEIDQQIQNGDYVEFMETISLDRFLKEIGKCEDYAEYLVNGHLADKNERIYSGDVIQSSHKVSPDDSKQHLSPPAFEQISESLPSPQQDKCPSASVPIQIVLNGEKLVLAPKSDHMPYQFLELLNLVAIDPTKPQGNILLQLNHKNASYLEYISDGDIVDIRWEKEKKQ